VERDVVQQLGVATAGRRLLDAGCGTGRRWEGCAAAFVAGIDLSPEMLARAPSRGSMAAADVRALPLPGTWFDVVWCRLVLGYVREVGLAYAELARVCRAGGVLVVTELHDDAIAAGHRRTFRDAAGALHELQQHAHTAHAHLAAAKAAGLQPLASCDGEVGPLVRDFYIRAGREALYEAQRGLRLVRGQSYRCAR
jgi:malonyl-CoA O-methyltransferase